MHRHVTDLYTWSRLTKFLYTVSEKVRHHVFVITSSCVEECSMCFRWVHSPGNLQWSGRYRFHLTSNASLHYLVKYQKTVINMQAIPNYTLYSTKSSRTAALYVLHIVLCKHSHYRWFLENVCFIMPPPTEVCWRYGMFCRCRFFLLFSKRNLEAPSADCHQSLRHVTVRKWVEFQKLGQKFWVPPTI